MAIEDTPNPIQVAAGLLNESIHILVGEGARQWADQQGFPKATVMGSDSPSGNDTVGCVAIVSQDVWPVASSTGGCSRSSARTESETHHFGVLAFWVDQNVAIAATGIGEEITLKMLCHRVAIHPGSLHEKLQHGLSLFDPSIKVGLIGISVEGEEGLGQANTETRGPSGVQIVEHLLKSSIDLQNQSSNSIGMFGSSYNSSNLA